MSAYDIERAPLEKWGVRVNGAQLMVADSKKEAVGAAIFHADCADVAGSFVRVEGDLVWEQE